jgi:carbon-monoxide dehydrogenase medium subunit
VKPSTFEYIRPESLAEALDVLGRHADEGKVLAGGQSLVPMMNFRLARPEYLVDINGIAGLQSVREADGRVHIGTLTRHLQLQTTTLSGPLGDLLRSAARHVGHLPIRTRGTFGGSIAHCDSASEWCLVANLLDAEMTARSHSRGERTIAARDFFLSIFTTALEADEILTSVALPFLAPNYRTGIAEFARRAGDFGIVAVATAVAVDDGKVTDARISIGGVSEIPLRAVAAEAVLTGQTWSDDLVQAAAEAAAAEVDPPSDTHGDAEYRRDLVRALLPRAMHVGDPASNGRGSEHR